MLCLISVLGTDLEGGGGRFVTLFRGCGLCLVWGGVNSRLAFWCGAGTVLFAEGGGGLVRTLVELGGGQGGGNG